MESVKPKAKIADRANTYQAAFNNATPGTDCFNHIKLFIIVSEFSKISKFI